MNIHFPQSPPGPASGQPPAGLENEIAILRGLIEQSRALADECDDLKTRLALLDKVSLACGRLATLLKIQAQLDHLRADRAGEQTRMERITRDVEEYLRQAGEKGDPLDPPG